ncbi:MAG: hydantoinase/oxoprolinase family protein [Vulcanimicrobiaceae bacterium]
MTTLRVGIDVGGTFTDLVALDVTTGRTDAIKVASTPRAPERGVLDALDALFARYERTPTLEYLAHATTIATNALLGQMHLELPRIAFLTTMGFRDVIEIGRQNRSEVYNLFVERPAPLVAREDRIGVRERMGYDGRAIEPLTAGEIERVIEMLRGRAIAAVAIGFLHAYANDDHERRLADAVTCAFPHLPVTRSSQADPEYREYERFSTTLVNAALLPIVQGYLSRLAGALQARGIDAPLYVMQSNGGMAAASHLAGHPLRMIESGPASGVIAASHLGRIRGIDRVLSFDMGGTTAKAGTAVDGAVALANEFEAAGRTHSGRSVKGSGYPVRFPFVDLAEVSAGGGTIAWLDDAGALCVGPISAGADPGPACYGISDRPTVTDANLVLGRLPPAHLVGGTFPIDASRSRDALAALATRAGLTLEACAYGIVRLVDADMAKVLRIVTVERGLDPRDFTLIAFGGNGPLHACALADELGMTDILVPARPGVFCADGLLVADLRISAVEPMLEMLERVDVASIDMRFERMEHTARASLREQGASEDRIGFTRSYDARYRGQSFELEIAGAGTIEGIARAFHHSHERRYGYSVPEESVELVALRVTATASLTARERSSAIPPERISGRLAKRSVWTGECYETVAIYQRASLAHGMTIDGPAMIEQYDSCTYLAPGWRLRNEPDALLLERR